MADDDKLARHEGPRHGGPARSSPYPVSRLAPAHDLVDAARQIAEADQVIGTVVHSKLQVIADQIRSLQAQAREIMTQAREDAALHRARCNFQKRVGHTYHLYERDDGTSYLSMLGADDWSGDPPHTFLGSYRLEVDMSWTPAGSDDRRPSYDELRALTGVDS